MLFSRDGNCSIKEVTSGAQEGILILSLVTFRLPPLLWTCHCLTDAVIMSRFNDLRSVTAALEARLEEAFDDLIPSCCEK